MTVNDSLNKTAARSGHDPRVWMALAIAVLIAIFSVAGPLGWSPFKNNTATLAPTAKTNASLKQRAFEERLERRVGNLLATIYGRENVQVALHADINFTERQTITEKYDPDGQVARTSFNRSGGTDLASPGLESALEEKVDYEISKSTSTVIEDAGSLKKLSAAILINSEAQTNLPVDMASIEPLIRTAIGFDGRRGDQLEVAFLPFSTMTASPSGILTDKFGQPLQLWIVAGIAFVSLFLLVIYGKSRKPRSPLSTPIRSQPTSSTTTALGQGDEGPGRHLATINERDPDLSTSELRSHVAQLVDQNPDRALAIMRSWLQENIAHQAKP